jgi:hypothetical protein
MSSSNATDGARNRGQLRFGQTADFHFEERTIEATTKLSRLTRPDERRNDPPNGSYSSLKCTVRSALHVANSFR